MTLGRVPTVQADIKVPLFSPIDDKFLSPSSTTSTQPEGIFSRTTFAVENVKLGEIIRQVLKQIYGGRRTTMSVDDQSISMPSFDSIIQLESMVSDFERNIPSELKQAWRSESHDADDAHARILQCQSFVLRARYVLSSSSSSYSHFIETMATDHKVKFSGCCTQINCSTGHHFPISASLLMLSSFGTTVDLNLPSYMGVDHL